MTGLSPARAANRINKALAAFAQQASLDRFPVDVSQLALECHRFFGWSDPISQVVAADLVGFEGALFGNEVRDQWLLVYNNALPSPGRIRFTQAHELGHYVLHRLLQQEFQCADASELRNLSADEQDLERQADEFASYLLMPLDDFRTRVGHDVDLDVLGECASRYGVSLTAATLKWLSYTDQKAVFVVSREGFIKWAKSSDAAVQCGAYFRSRRDTLEVPSGVLAADNAVIQDRAGQEVPLTRWFPHADPGLSLREMKIRSEQYDLVHTLLILPRIADVRPPFNPAGR